MTENTHTFSNGNTRRLDRSRSDRMVAGVAGGLARYFDIHPAVYRVGFVVLTVLGGAGIVIYLALALVMPDEGKGDSIATAVRPERRVRQQHRAGDRDERQPDQGPRVARAGCGVPRQHGSARRRRHATS